MNLGKTILELRKDRGVKQEELAAELGVTAAAVSKWENGYTLPDVLMLCALADYFQVTTDSLLGRDMPVKKTVIAADTKALGEKIGALAKRYGIEVKGIYTDLEEAVAEVKADETVTHLLVAYPGGIEGVNTTLDWGDRSISLCLDLSNTEKNILSGMEEFLNENH